MMERIEQNFQDQRTLEKLKFLSALIKSGASSDRELAKSLGITHSSASRRRKKIEQEDYIKEYTVIPNFSKLGIEIVAFSFGAPVAPLTPDQISNARKWMSEQPEILLCMEGQGLDSNFLMVSVHKNYESYLTFLRNMRSKQISRTWNMHTFIVGTDKEVLVLKPFSLRNMEALFLPPETKPVYPKRRKGMTQSASRHSD